MNLCFLWLFQFTLQKNSTSKRLGELVEVKTGHGNTFLGSEEEGKWLRVFFFSRFRVGASHLGHKLAVLSEMENLDQKKKKKDADLPQENERKQFSRGSSVFKSGGWCLYVCVCLCGTSSVSSVTVRPSDHVGNCRSWDCVKLRRAQISSLWSEYFSEKTFFFRFLELHHHFSPPISYHFSQQEKKMAWSRHFCRRKALRQRPDVLAQKNMLVFTKCTIKRKNSVIWKC